MTFQSPYLQKKARFSLNNFMIRCPLVVDCMPFGVLVDFGQRDNQPVLLHAIGGGRNVGRQLSKPQNLRLVLFVVVHLKRQGSFREVQHDILGTALFPDILHVNVQFHFGSVVEKGVRRDVAFRVVKGRVLRDSVTDRRLLLGKQLGFGLSVPLGARGFVGVRKVVSVFSFALQIILQGRFIVGRLFALLGRRRSGCGRRFHHHKDLEREKGGKNQVLSRLGQNLERETIAGELQTS